MLRIHTRIGDTVRIDNLRQTKECLSGPHIQADLVEDQERDKRMMLKKT